MDYNIPNQPLNDQQDSEKGKMIGILSYCTLIGWIVAIVMHQNDKTRFGAFHLRQALGIWIAYLCCFIVIMITAPFLFFMSVFLLPVVGITTLVFVILGLVNAVNGKMKPTPLIGGLAEKMLAGVK
jgi:uncharacterized membrane protein